MNNRITHYLIATIVALVPILSHGQSLDVRNASMHCFTSDGDLLTCKYRTSPNISIKEVSISVGNDPVQIPEGGLTNFPSEGDTVAVLILVDVSDPSRKATVEDKSLRIVQRFVSARKDYESIGVATFDSDLSVIAPIGSTNEQIAAALKSVKATGQSTEFYKSILAAIDILKKSDASRKGLVVISDGKDEDRAYSLKDAVQAAGAAEIPIMGIGFAEKPSDSPYLQTLQRLSDESYGEYLNATDNRFANNFTSNPFGFLEKGGQVQIDVAGFHGNQKISLSLGAADNKVIELTESLDFSAQRTISKRIIGFVISNWPWLLAGLIALGMFAALLVKHQREKRTSNLPNPDYAYLIETDGLGSRHVINKTASRIGRSKDNDIILINDSISSHHAEIHMRREGVFYVVDLSSTNGVYVNDQRINQVEINDGDLIELGEVRLRFVIA